MTDREPAPAAKLVDVAALKQVLTFIGITGAGGGGFAALCFGIGFLAIRHHDEMLGLPSRTGAYGAMVRTGAMFFPNSLYSVLFGTWKATAALFVLALAAWSVVGMLLRRKRTVAVPRAASVAYFLVAHVVLLVIGLALFEDRAAMFHPSNRQMLLARPEAEELANARTGVAASFRYFVVDRLEAKAARVGAELRSDASPARNQEYDVARKHYGQSAAFLGMFLVLLVLERLYWREESSRLLRWLMRPVLYAVAAVLVLTLPGSYGVLWTSNQATYVEISTVPSDPPVIGYLLTDISGDEPDVWTLALADHTFALRVFKRESISEIRVVPDASTDNLLRVAASYAAPARPPKEVASAAPVLPR